LGNGKFQDVTASAGAAFNSSRVARGAAYGDYNNDGALDLVVATNNGPAVLFRNTGAANHSLRIKLEGVKSNRDGIGAVARVTSAGGTQTEMLRSGSSYLSSSELVLTFGLGANTQADAVEIRWPSRQVDKLANVQAGQIITVKEGSGIIAAKPQAKRAM
ncbi:MAG: CRTAC1 family protein, partial [Methylocella sp.]